MSGPEGFKELNKIAVRFEEDVFSNATSQTDYLRKISMKMLTMETKSQNTAGSLASLPTANNTTSLEPGHLMDNNNWRPSLPKEKSAIDTNDWRTQLPPDSRQRIVNKIMETLKKHLPFSGQEGINELRRVSVSFEEKFFEAAVNQTNYLWKISMKMLTMETKSQNSAGSSPSIPAVNNSLALNLGHHWDNVNSNPSLPKKEPSVNTDDWRTQLPPGSRQKNANEILEPSRIICSKFWERRNRRVHEICCQLRGVNFQICYKPDGLHSQSMFQDTDWMKATLDHKQKDKEREPLSLCPTVTIFDVINSH